MTKYKFSIITVCFNSDETIEETIKSMINQDINDYEYIIIDGGSTDKTLEIVKRYEDKFNNIKWISEKDDGIYNAMNKGLSMCTGELIGFLNSDDYYENNILKKVYEDFKKVDADIIYGSSRLIYTNGNNKIIRAEKPIENITRNTLKKGMGFIHQSCFVKKEVFDSIGQFDEKFKTAADWDFIIRAFNSNFKFFKTNYIISYFSKDGVSSKCHIKERNSVRKKNKLYKFIDIEMLKEIINPSNILKFVLKEEIYLKLRLSYQKLKLKVG